MKSTLQVSLQPLNNLSITFKQLSMQSNKCYLNKYTINFQIVHKHPRPSFHNKTLPDHPQKIKKEKKIIQYTINKRELTTYNKYNIIFITTPYPHSNYNQITILYIILTVRIFIKETGIVKLRSNFLQCFQTNFQRKILFISAYFVLWVKIISYVYLPYIDRNYNHMKQLLKKIPFIGQIIPTYTTKYIYLLIFQGTIKIMSQSIIKQKPRKNNEQ
eukprot:TRINITY_DN15243_c0_g1_i1.p1 TRINITY_DN15243_c0_g1~~TRINITY_DN15243_c0_g1_i1.p1  ORF type:complete len:216 (-),score=-23.85 TRINITY_DN15243_c0_g1_i1:73-720(-)